jgi:hypothetical protein
MSSDAVGGSLGKGADVAEAGGLDLSGVDEPTLLGL